MAVQDCHSHGDTYSTDYVQPHARVPRTSSPSRSGTRRGSCRRWRSWGQRRGARGGEREGAGGKGGEGRVCVCVCVCVCMYVCVYARRRMQIQIQGVALHTQARHSATPSVLMLMSMLRRTSPLATACQSDPAANCTFYSISFHSILHVQKLSMFRVTTTG
jgi:hypothetical protein